jgi:hypothetical protein
MIGPAIGSFATDHMITLGWFLSRATSSSIARALRQAFRGDFLAIGEIAADGRDLVDHEHPSRSASCIASSAYGFPPWIQRSSSTAGR